MVGKHKTWYRGRKMRRREGRYDGSEREWRMRGQRCGGRKGLRKYITKKDMGNWKGDE